MCPLNVDSLTSTYPLYHKSNGNLVKNGGGARGQLGGRDGPYSSETDIEAVSFEKCQETPPTWEIPQPDGDLGAVT